MKKLKMIFIFILTALPPLPSPSSPLLKKALLLSEYIEADWSRAVRDGKVISEFEYNEMVEFCSEILRALSGTELEGDAKMLCKEIERKSDRVPEIAGTIKRKLVRKVLEPPPFEPDPDEGKRIFEQKCAVCHAGEGRKFLWQGQEWWAFPLTSPHITPSKVFLITLFGIEGTPMQAFWMSDRERWSLAYYVGALRFTQDVKPSGKLDDYKVLRDITFLSSDELFAKYGERTTDTYLSVFRQDNAKITKSMLEDAVKLWKEGKRQEALLLLDSAYLRFERLEPFLGKKAVELELEFARARKGEKFAESVGKVIDELEGDVGRIGKTISAFTVVVREGVEAVLIVSAILGVVSAGGGKTLVVHIGWVAGALFGALLWFATGLFLKLPASRALLEGILTLIAVFIIIWVSWWVLSALHSQMIKEIVRKAKTRSGNFGIFSVAFLATARESGEMVFMLRAIGEGIVEGVLLGALAVAVFGVIVFVLKAKLNLRQFFIFTNVLLNIIAVTLIGKAIVEFQEAGVLPAKPLHIPFPLDLVFSPSLQAIAVQVALALFLFTTTAIYIKTRQYASH